MFLIQAQCYNDLDQNATAETSWRCKNYVGVCLYTELRHIMLGYLHATFFLLAVYLLLLLICLACELNI